MSEAQVVTSVAHNFNRCHCDQWGRCLVHCATCHCGEDGRHVFIGRDCRGIDQWAWLPAVAPRTDCGHDSANGIDQTALDDPSKVWHCAQCGVLFRSIEDADCIAHDVPLTTDDPHFVGIFPARTGNPLNINQEPGSL